jgi:hypothetical protein
LEAPKASNLVFGLEIHYMLKLYYEKNFKSAESFANFFAHRWRQTIAGKFLDRKPSNFSIDSINYTFQNGDTTTFDFGNHIRWLGERNPPETELPLSADFGDYSLTGKVDRLDHLGDIYVNVDYKTSKAPPTKHFLRTSIQFTIYDLLLAANGRKVTNHYIYYLRSGKFFGVSARETHHFDTLEKILRKITDGVNQEAYVPSYGLNCDYCQFTDQCADYSVGAKGPILHGSVIDPINHTDWMFEE